LEEEEGGLKEVEAEDFLPGHFLTQRASLGQQAKPGNDHIWRLLVKKMTLCTENFLHSQG
jgi:hypothetical protein